MVAFDAAGDPDRYPEQGEPWQPLKLYYHMGFTKKRVATLHEAHARRRARVAVRGVAEELGRRRDKSARITTRVRAASTSSCATTRCGRTPPRSTRTAAGSRCRCECS